MHLNAAEGLSGYELLIPPDADANLVTTLVRAAIQRADLPLWVKLPLKSAVTLAPIAVTAGAVGIVVGQPPTGAAVRQLENGTSNIESTSHTVPASNSVSTYHTVLGPLFGPLAFPPMLEVLIRVAALKLPAALIACGGIHTLDQIHQALTAGAQSHPDRHRPMGRTRTAQSPCSPICPLAAAQRNGTARSCDALAQVPSPSRSARPVRCTWTAAKTRATHLQGASHARRAITRRQGSYSNNFICCTGARPASRM